MKKVIGARKANIKSKVAKKLYLVLLSMTLVGLNPVSSVRVYADTQVEADNAQDGDVLFQEDEGNEQQEKIEETDVVEDNTVVEEDNSNEQSNNEGEKENNGSSENGSGEEKKDEEKVDENKEGSSTILPGDQQGNEGQYWDPSIPTEEEKKHLEPTPTPTPTPTPEPEYSRYINTSSDEFIASEDGIYHETKSKVVMDFYEVNEMIAFYSKVFQLDDTKVGNKIYEIIEQDEDAWKEENILNGIQYESKEQAIARTIADISNFPQNYGLGDIEVDEYELSHYEPEELIYKFSDVIGVNPYIALAVAYSESGTKLDSYNFETRYNVGGLRRRSGDPHPATSWGLTIYKNEAEGLYRFITILHDNFFVERDSGYDRIKAMSYSYCEDPSHWRNLVGSVYYNLTDNGYAYYYNKFKGYRDLVYPTKEKEYTI